MDDKKEITDAVIERLDILGMHAQQIAGTLVEEAAIGGWLQLWMGLALILVATTSIVTVSILVRKEKLSADNDPTPAVVWVVGSIVLLIGIVTSLVGIYEAMTPTTTALKALIGTPGL